MTLPMRFLYIILTATRTVLLELNVYTFDVITFRRDGFLSVLRNPLTMS
jgi:hypothetical protein